MRALPPDGFDWSAAWGLEAAVLEFAFKNVLRDPTRVDRYEQALGQAMPPEAGKFDMGKFQTYMERVQEALKLPQRKQGPRFRRYNLNIRRLALLRNNSSAACQRGAGGNLCRPAEIAGGTPHGRVTTARADLRESALGLSSIRPNRRTAAALSFTALSENPASRTVQSLREDDAREKRQACACENGPQDMAAVNREQHVSTNFGHSSS